MATAVPGPPYVRPTPAFTCGRLPACHRRPSGAIMRWTPPCGAPKQPGRVSDRPRLSRGAFLVFLAQVPQGTVVMEACGSAHYWGRKIQELGHQVVLLPPHQVRPYVTRNKTVRTDAKGILEAYRNADIHPVSVKSVAQQVLVSLHRFRSGWIASRTAQVNTLRGLLPELGFVIPP